MRTMSLIVALLLAGLAVAGHVTQPARGDASSLANSTTMPVVEAQLSRKKLASGNGTGNGIMWWPGDTNLSAALDHGIIKNVVSDKFDLITSNLARYMAFMSDLDHHVSATGARWIRQHPVLGPQNLRDRPATWFGLTLTGAGGEDADYVIFMLRSDNLYISGFWNRFGLFSFKPQEGQYGIPYSNVLSFGNGYKDFFGRTAHRGLLNVGINKGMAVTQLAVLANFQGGDDAHLKIPSAFFVLMLAEAERFMPLRVAVSLLWAETYPRSIDVRVPSGAYLIDLVVNWRTFSCAILSWDEHHQSTDAWNRNIESDFIKTFGVERPEDAMLILNPILQPVRSKCTWTPRN